MCAGAAHWPQGQAAAAAAAADGRGVGAAYAGGVISGQGTTGHRGTT